MPGGGLEVIGERAARRGCGAEGGRLVDGSWANAAVASTLTAVAASRMGEVMFFMEDTGFVGLQTLLFPVGPASRRSR